LKKLKKEKGSREGEIELKSNGIPDVVATSPVVLR